MRARTPESLRRGAGLWLALVAAGLVLGAGVCGAETAPSHDASAKTHTGAVKAPATAKKLPAAAFAAVQSGGSSTARSVGGNPPAAKPASPSSVAAEAKPAAKSAPAKAEAPHAKSAVASHAEAPHAVPVKAAPAPAKPAVKAEAAPTAAAHPAGRADAKTAKPAAKSAAVASDEPPAPGHEAAASAKPGSKPAAPAKSASAPKHVAASSAVAANRVASSKSVPVSRQPVAPGATAAGAPAPATSFEEKVNYQYNALGRRDPFQSMIDGEFVGEDVGGDAPPDVGGMRVVGIVWGDADKFAMVEDGRGNSHVLRPGDKVMNGVVSGLKRDGVTFTLTTDDGQSQSVTVPLIRKGEKNASR